MGFADPDPIPHQNFMDPQHWPEADFSGHVEAVNGGPGLHERPVEEVAVVGDENVRPHVQNVIEEALEQLALVRLVEHDEGALELGLRGVFEILHGLTDDFSGKMLALIYGSRESTNC